VKSNPVQDALEQVVNLFEGLDMPEEIERTRLTW